MSLNIVIDKFGDIIGLFALRRNNQVIFINRESGSFVYMNDQLFSERFSLKALDITDITFWKNLLIKKREMYDNLKYQFCTDTIDNLTLTLGNSYFSFDTDTISKCLICEDDFKINTKMISFHQEHNIHLCCPQCFCNYRNLICPLCESNKNNIIL